MIKDKDATLILSYLLVYQAMEEAEIVYSETPTYGNQIKYLAAHTDYESALGKLLNNKSPFEVAEIIAKLSLLCKSVVKDLAENFPITKE